MMMIETDAESAEEAWFSLDGEALSERLIALMEEHDDEVDLHWALFAFYNSLMERGQAGDVSVALSRARTTVDTFRCRALAEFEAMFLEAVARLSISSGDLAAALDAMEGMADRATPDQAQEVAELAKDFWDTNRNDFRLEVSGLTLASVSRVYAKLGEAEPQVRAMLEAANLYAHNGAKEPARAALMDALDVARRSGSPELIARVLTDATVIGYDRRDADAGLAAADEALAIWRGLSKPPPFRLVANRATLLMQVDRLEEAVAVFEDLLEVSDPDERFHLLSNLASIRRRQGRFKDASRFIEEARASRKQGSVGEMDLELELIAANLAATTGDVATLLATLSAACATLDAGLASIFRLHHRRGFRERYLGRIEALMAALPSTGAAKDVVPFLATVHGGVVADWMAVLAWAAELDPSCAETKAVRDAVMSVQRYGAPFIPRLIEDRDLAWMPNLEGRSWDVLSLAIDAVLIGGVSPPHDRVNLGSTQDVLNERLEQGWALLVPTISDDELILWLLFSGAYTRVAFDLKHVFTFCKARDRFARGAITRTDFQAVLADYVDRLSTALEPELAQLLASCPGLFVLQDLFDSIPMMAIALNLDGLRARMTDGLFELRTVPVLIRGEEEKAFSDPSIVAVIDSADNLPLAKHEGALLACAFAQTAPPAFEATDDAGILAALTGADILVVSTHGMSIAQYGDPAFASLGGGAKPHAIRVGTIQERFPALPYRLVLLNACHAGAASVPFVNHGLRTHDSAGYPALLLMNRRSVVSAPGWPIFDNVSLLHAGLVGEGVAADGLSASRAHSRATARLWEMTRKEVVERFEAMPQYEGLAGVIARFRVGSPDDPLFHHPYVCGGFAAYTLI